MNSELKDKKYRCPDSIIANINTQLTNYKEGGSTKGLRRAKHIVNDKYITYQDMKRIKNYFDKYDGNGSDDEFLLNGGKSMRKWVNKALGNSRDTSKQVKSAKRDGGLKNAFYKEHDKNTNKDPMNVNVPKIKGGNKTVYESEIKQIQYLIEYMDNNINKIL